MKKILCLGMLLFSVAALAIVVTGCDEEKDDNTLVLAALAGAQTWEIVAPVNGATGVSRNPTFVFQSNCELDTENDPDEDYVELVYSEGSATANLTSATCDPFTIEGDTVTMTIDSEIGSLPFNTELGPVVIHGFRCKSPRVAKKQYAFEDYSVTTSNVP
jgi:hypothetical protein